MVDTVLEGCEIICIGERDTDLIACPLSREGQLSCLQYRQYQAGVKEVVEWVESISCNQEDEVDGQRFLLLVMQISTAKWQAKLKEWGIEC